MKCKETWGKKKKIEAKPGNKDSPEKMKTWSNNHRKGKDKVPWARKPRKSPNFDRKTTENEERTPSERPRKKSSRKDEILSAPVLEREKEIFFTTFQSNLSTKGPIFGRSKLQMWRFVWKKIGEEEEEVWKCGNKKEKGRLVLYVWLIQGRD